ncbi:MAG: CRISPR-associated helicase Cas3, partial [bacterium]
EVPKFDVGSTYVYDEHILLRSALVLVKYPQIQIPSDIEPLIEACYGEVNCPSDASVELQNQWQKTKTELEKELMEMQNSAEQVTIPSPYSAYDILELCNRRLEEDRPDLHPLLQASTRLSEPTVAVVCLLPDQYDQFNWDEKPDLPQTQKLLKHSFTLQHKSLVFQLLGKFDKDVYPTTWATSALLRNYRLLLLDKNACWYDDDGKYQICLDPELGIVINKLS